MPSDSGVLGDSGVSGVFAEVSLYLSCSQYSSGSRIAVRKTFYPLPVVREEARSMPRDCVKRKMYSTDVGIFKKCSDIYT